MTAGGMAPAGLQRLGVVPLSILAAAFALLGLNDAQGAGVGVIVAIAAVAVSLLWRIFGERIAGGAELLPVAGALAYFVLVAPTTVVSEVLAGFAALALLLWLAHVTAETPGRLSRALDQLIMPMAGFAIALGIAFVLPPEPLSLGFASLLLVLVIVVVVLILSRPSLVGRREAPSS
jgi:Flp pilus assembly protein protease CpaA